MFASRPAVALLLCAAAACAQATKAELTGAVLDPAGLPVAGARVTVVNEATGLTAAKSTAADGSYLFLALPAGLYALTVSGDGFTLLRRASIALRVGGRVSVDVEMRLADAADAIEVTAAPPLLETGRGSVSFPVDQKKVATVPLDGRNFVPLVALSPGVSLPPGSVLPRINGSRPRVSEYLYDGVSVLQPEPGQVAFYPIIDAIDEFRVETSSYSAEYGRSNGGVILVSQKSGSNTLHGTMFEFFRNEKLNARNLFADAGAKPRFRRNQYGFVLGGPIQKNRTFFFADWQGTRLNTGVVRTSTVPTEAQKRGVFNTAIYDPATTRRTGDGYQRDGFAGNVIPAARFDRAALAVLDRYPSPNAGTGPANNYRRVGNDDTRADQIDGRLDRYFGARHRVFGRYSLLRDETRITTPLPDRSSDTRTQAMGAVAEYTLTVSPGAVNQLRFGYTRRGFERRSGGIAQPVGQVTAIPNIPVSSFADVLPVYDVVGFQQLGPPAGGNADFATSVSQWIENYSWVRGGHSVKAGADIRIETLNVLQPSNPTGNFQFPNIFTGPVGAAGGNSFASFLLGQTGLFSIDAQQEVIKPRARIAEFLLQDDWRLSRRLTWNLGVRYTLNFPSTVVGDRGAVFNLVTQKLERLGENGRPRHARDLEKANFGPRVGLAFRVTDSFAIRAGYGLTWIEQAGITTPFTTPLFPFIQTLGQQTLDNIAPAFVLSSGPTVAIRPVGADAGLGQGVFGVQRDNGSGYAQQWNLTLQKSFASNWSVEAGYLGSKLTRLGVPDGNLNQLTVEQLGLGSRLIAPLPLGQLLRPYPRFTTVALYRNNIGHSTYHSLQARVERRFSQGLTFTGAYTFSRLIDDAGAVFDAAVLSGPVTNFQAADSFNRRLEKDVSTGSIPHVFTSGFVWEPPRWKGWQLGGIARRQSGSAVAVTQAVNLNAFAGFGIQRPNRLRDPALASAMRTTGRWFDTAAFGAAAQFTIGNSSRNPVIGPGYTTVDLMIGKTVSLGERMRAEFRAEVFNAANTPPLGNPNGSFGSAAFGAISTALDPRVFELVLKLHF